MFLSKRKNDEYSAKTKEIEQLLLPSVLSILLCAVCLVGSTFAWFTSASATATQTIQPAKYTVSVKLTDGSNADIIPEDGVYTLHQGEYKVELTAEGTASSGYCIFRFNMNENDKIHTEQIPQGETVTVSLEVANETRLEIIPQWGKSNADEADKIKFSEAYIRD